MKPRARSVYFSMFIAISASQSPFVPVATLNSRRVPIASAPRHRQPNRKWRNRHQTADRLPSRFTICAALAGRSSLRNVGAKCARGRVERPLKRFARVLSRAGSPMQDVAKGARKTPLGVVFGPKIGGVEFQRSYQRQTRRGPRRWPEPAAPAPRLPVSAAAAPRPAMPARARIRRPLA